MPGGTALAKLIEPAPEETAAEAAVPSLASASSLLQPWDRVRPSSESSPMGSKWPPKPHLSYETIGDIVPFLQVRPHFNHAHKRAHTNNGMWIAVFVL